MSYKEKDLTSEFSLYLRKNPQADMLQFVWVAEYKVKHNGETLHLERDFQPQQIPSLLKATNSCIYYKFSDMSQGLKPFDAAHFCNVPAFVGVCWYKPRIQKTLYLIDVKDIKKRLDQNNPKYTEEDAKKEAVFTIELM